MERTISLPEDVYARLEALARPFVDRDPVDVIRRLLDSPGEGERFDPPSPPQTEPVSSPASPSSTRVDGRIARERGARVQLDEHLIQADSVRDLYEQTLHYLSSNGVWERVVELAPYKTSSRRYLISETPIHPNGKRFVVPVQHRNLYMETHKNYQTAITQLDRLLGRCGIKVTYLGV